jgi:hypothetical protein
LTVFVVVIIAAVAAMALLLVTAGDAEGWSYTAVYGDSTTYLHSGTVYRTTTWDTGPWDMENYGKSTSYPICEYYSYSYGTYGFYSYYKGYVGIPISSFDSRTWINAATFYMYVGNVNSYNNYVSCYLLSFDASVADAQQTFSMNGYSLGYVYVGSSTGTWSFSITGSALTYIRNAIADGDEYIYFGFTGSSGNGYYAQIYPTSSYAYFEYDASAPDAPTLSTLNRYSAGSYIYLYWLAPSDNPTGGNRGLSAYMIGVFDNSATLTPLYTIGWLSSYYSAWSLGPLEDGKTYYFRMMARDSSGFESGWSSYMYTTMDASPPSIPIIDPEPLFTTGTTNSVKWAASTDAGIGVSYYQVHMATNPDFTGGTIVMVTAYTNAFTRLVSGTTYYYRVRAIDSFGYVSQWSSIQYSTQDDAPPSVPELVAEPLYTAGATNTFMWQPSYDAGVGVAQYRVQVANDPSFGAGTIVLDTATTETYAIATGLGDGITYYARVNAVDAFSYASAWSLAASSTQDASGPGSPGLSPLPAFSPWSPLDLSWSGATDAGIGVGWYTVRWSSSQDFTAELTIRDHVLGQSLMVPTLTKDKKWYLSVVAFDILGNEGTTDKTNTTLDGTPPSAPVVDQEPAFTQGFENTIAWTASTDALSGVDHYVLDVYGRGVGMGLVYTDATDTLSLTVPGLSNGATYWYVVVAVDLVGNRAASDAVTSIQDGAPPLPPSALPLPMFTKGTDLTVSWQPSIDTGIGGVEYSVDWTKAPDFSTVDGTSPWASGTSYTATGLDDGATYFLRVRARDGFSQVSVFGSPTYTTMDSSPPPTPTLAALGTYVPGPGVMLSWGAVVDGSGRTVEYRVHAFLDEDLMGDPDASSPWTTATSFELLGLQKDKAYHFIMVARDPFDLVSPASAAVSTTIDGTGPVASTMAALGEFTRGTSVTLTWTAGNDAGVGGVETRLLVYLDAGLTAELTATSWGTVSAATVHGLVDGLAYWFVVEGRDAFDNVGTRSTIATTTMDATPPAIHADVAIFGPSDGAVRCTATDAGSGIGSVEASGNGGTTWVEATLDSGKWKVDFTALPTGATDVLLRATDNVGNAMAPPVHATVDTTPPAVVITSPTSGAVVTGAMPIIGTVSDTHLQDYTVEYSFDDGVTWKVVQPAQATGGVSGVLATWLPGGLVGGLYKLRVTATDALSQTTQATVDVVLKAARLSIAPNDITFSNTHPLPGESVTVYVTVRNEGDSPAEGMTVKLYSGTTEVGSLSNVDVPANGMAVVPLQVKAKDSMTFTAKATSTLYDTGEMAQGQPLKAIEKEAPLENAGGILGMLALVLAVVCLVLIVLNMRKAKAAPASPPSTPEGPIIA